ncbi:MAG: DUF58 domain-containing protein [Gammaproteobacteria bacterium]
MTRPLVDEGFLQRLERLRLQTRCNVQARNHGDRLSRHKGIGLEFFDYRPYVEGDDVRYVDWNVYCRLDRLVLKLVVDEQDLCLHLLIDTSSSMGAGSAPKLDYALKTAGAFAYIALCNHERVAAGLFNDQLYRMLQPCRGRRQFLPLLERLAEARASGRTDLRTPLKQYALRSRTPGLAILVSDLLDTDDGYQDGIRSLLSRGFEVQLLHLLSEEELHPTLDGDLELVDWESGSKKLATIDAGALGRYQRELEQFCTEVEGFCERYGVAYVRVSDEIPFEELMFRTLRERQFLQ